MTTQKPRVDPRGGKLAASPGVVPEMDRDDPVGTRAEI